MIEKERYVILSKERYFECGKKTGVTKYEAQMGKIKSGEYDFRKLA